MKKKKKVLGKGYAECGIPDQPFRLLMIEWYKSHNPKYKSYNQLIKAIRQ